MADNLSETHEKSPEQKQLDVLNRTYDVSAACRKKVDRHWKKYLEWFMGDQKMQNRPRGRSNTVTNFLFSEIETIVPILTSNMPGVSIFPDKTFGPAVDRWREISEELARQVNRVFKRNNIQERMAENVTYGELWGKGYLKATWDSAMRHGHGDIYIEAPDTRSIYLEPGKMFLRDANYVFHVTELDVLSLVRKYPDKMKQIKGLISGMDSGKEEFNKLTENKERGVRGVPTGPEEAPSTQTVTFFEAASMIDPKNPQLIKLKEAWFYDDELHEVQVDIKDGKSPKKDKSKEDEVTPLVKRFPEGRVVQFSDNIIFDDRSNKHPGIPFFEYFNYFIPGQQYGMGDIEQAIPIQEQYNIRNNQIYDNINYQAHPKTLIGHGADVDTDAWTNAPDGIVITADVNQIKTLPPHMLNEAVIQSLPRIKQELETIIGVREVTQGTVPSDVRSGAAIEALQEAADVRLRRKSTALETQIKDMSRFIIDLMSLFYRKNEHYDSKFHSKSEDSMGIGLDNITADMFDIEISAGVNAPRSKIAQQQERQWMFDRKIIGPLIIVENSTLENKEEVITLMSPTWKSQKEAEDAALQQALQPQQPPAGGP